MNLVEESVRNAEQKKKKRTTGIILTAIIILVIIIIGIASYLVYVQTTTLRVILDGKENAKVKQLLVFNDDGTIDVPIKEIASYLGYQSYNGSYNEKSEQANKCYVQNDNEVANFSLSSNQIDKLDLTKTDANYEIEKVKDPVKSNNGVLYASSEAIEKGFNVSFEYDKDANRVYIYTLPYLIQSYSGKVLDYGYKEISNVFANQKAILQNMLVVQKDENGVYAVLDTKGNAVLEPKYDNIEYLPETGDFQIESNKKVGIIGKDGKTKVQPYYDAIDLMDSASGLYLVQKDKKYGVIDIRGNTKIYIENDEIGLDISPFEQNNIKNLGFLLDIGNISLCDKEFNIQDISNIKNYVQHIQLKNFQIKNNAVKFTSLEEGIIEYHYILQEIKKIWLQRNINIGIETDIWNSTLRYRSIKESVRYLKNYLKEK